jgi:hypothetical protein
MPTLNRFPLLGLWGREAAHRLGYKDSEADTLGHAYAVLYAIRANRPSRAVEYKDKEAAEAAREALATPSDIDLLSFGGDELQVSRDGRGRLVGRVGNALPQTAESYRYKVVRKFPEHYHEKVRDAFRSFFETCELELLDSRELYNLYDRWKKLCGVGRLVDLDKLIRWCQENRRKTRK